MMPLGKVFLAIAVMAFATFLTRVIPFLFFRNSNPPKIIVFLEEYIPPMVMLLLVLYCLKDVNFKAMPYGLPEIIGISVVASLHIWKRNALLSIFGGTLLYMMLIQTNILSF